MKQEVKNFETQDRKLNSKTADVGGGYFFLDCLFFPFVLSGTVGFCGVNNRTELDIGTETIYILFQFLLLASAYVIHCLLYQMYERQNTE